MGNHSPSRYRREGREAFSPGLSFDDVFPRKAGFWDLAMRHERLIGWQEAEAERAAAQPAEDAVRSRERAVESVLFELGVLLGSVAAHHIDELIKARLTQHEAGDDL